MLTPRDVLDELLYPLKDPAMLLALLFFSVLFSLAIFSGLFGLWLMTAIVPGFFQYLLVVMQARADNKEAPAVDVELFSFAQRLWSLFPMVLVTLAGLAIYYLASTGREIWAVVALGLTFMLLPLSLAVLTITHSAIECLRPSRLWLVARNWGHHYLMVIGVSVTGGVLVYLTLHYDLFMIVTILFTLYAFLLIASVGGHALAIQEAEIEISIPDPVLPGPLEVERKENQVRTHALNHAYGMVSRGNCAGGVRHVLNYIQDSPDPLDCTRWLFTQMLNWESPQAALQIGQQLVSRLLAAQLDKEALKTIVRCRHANPAFTLLEADRVPAMRLAKNVYDPALKEWLAGGGD